MALILTLEREFKMGTRKTPYAIPANFAPITRLQANRWLNSATFGAATARANMNGSTKLAFVPMAAVSPTTPGGLEEDDAVRLMRIGYEAYINEQLLDTTPRTAMTFSAVSVDGGGGHPNEALRQLWWGEAMHCSAQIRLKTAYILSQIFVTNTTASVFTQSQQFNLRYYDNLVKATLSSNTSTFRELLIDVTLSNAMARMLTYQNNTRANPASSLEPDQNYIRELLQLMTPGLFHQNMDGTFNLDANGVKIQTFLPSQMRLLAGAITGIGNNQLSGIVNYILQQMVDVCMKMQKLRRLTQ